MILQGNALEAAGWVIVGARGWTAPDDPAALPGDDRVFRREIAGMRASIEDADRHATMAQQPQRRRGQGGA